MTARIAVLASGGGTNLQAILDYLRARDQRAGDVVLVASDRAEAGALQRARDAGISCALVRTTRTPDARSMLGLLQHYHIDFVALAGYLRLVPTEVLAEYPSRVLNVHPALLPSFGGPGMYGDRVHRAVLAAGATVSGATVHYVDEEYDHGTILAQWPVPVLADDAVPALAARVLRVEHVLYPRVVEAVASGRWRYDTRPRAVPESASFALMNWDESRLVQDIEQAFGFT